MPVFPEDLSRYFDLRDNGYGDVRDTADDVRREIERERREMAPWEPAAEDACDPLPPYTRRCTFCRKPINELKESHVKDGGYPVPNWWHIPCWNEAQEIASSWSEYRHMEGAF
jgi:hypothetical protein